MSFTIIKMSLEKFDKDYKYTIDHYYGRVGKRENKAPYGCRKVIMQQAQIPTGEYHGCPFTHAPKDEVLQILKTYKLPLDSFNGIMEKTPLHPQIACRRLFEAAHPNASDMDFVGTSPNAWFDKSVKYHSSNP